MKCVDGGQCTVAGVFKGVGRGSWVASRAPGTVDRGLWTVDGDGERHAVPALRRTPDAARPTPNARRPTGFTLIELMIVLAIIALLVSIVAPRYVGGLAKAEEAVLMQDLVRMREALDRHYADAGRYPERLEDLVAKRYLRRIPDDPLTRSSTTWIAIPPEDPDKGGVYDVRSGAPGTGSDGRPYAQR